METTGTTATDRQAIRGNCPATGRSASACLDQTHMACWVGRDAFIKAERALERMNP